VVAVAGAIVFWLAFSSAQLRAVDSGLSAQAQVIHAGLRTVGPAVTFEGQYTLPSETARRVAMQAVLLSSTGAVIMHSNAAPSERDLLPVLKRPSDPTLGSYATLPLGGQDERILVRAESLPGGGSATLVLARSLAEFEETQARTAVFLAITVAALVTVASLAGYVLAGRTLRPVRVIASTAKDLSQHDLHRRITLPLPPDELGELAATFNGMLERLEQSFMSLHRFTADAAHELRAPLAIMRTEVQVTLEGPADLAEHRTTLQAVLRAVERLTRTADQLLLLARADAGVLRPRLASVDIVDLLGEAAVRWHPALEDRGIRLSIDLPACAPVLADRDMLHRVLDNLLDNACRHTPRGGTVTIDAGCASDGVEFVIRDTGPGVDPSISDRIFDRFTRADPARGRDTGGAGLGLSICAAIVALHGGMLGLDEGGRGASFRVWLPGSATL
jgi:heavy metal sensor kinase